MLINVSPTGQVSLIYSDEMIGLLAEGTAEVTRASAVEPAEGGGWTATMTDGTVLGPYALRQTALDEEVNWIEAKMLA